MREIKCKNTDRNSIENLKTMIEIKGKEYKVRDRERKK